MKHSEIVKTKFTKNLGEQEHRNKHKFTTNTYKHIFKFFEVNIGKVVYRRSLRIPVTTLAPSLWFVWCTQRFRGPCFSFWLIHVCWQSRWTVNGCCTVSSCCYCRSWRSLCCCLSRRGRSRLSLCWCWSFQICRCCWVNICCWWDNIGQPCSTFMIM